MRSSVLIASAGLALTAGSVLANEITEYFVNQAPTQVSSFRLGTTGGFRFTEPSSSPNPGTPIYNMDDVAVTGSFSHGGAAVQGANTITRLVADDLGTISYSYGSVVTRMYWSVTNANTVSVSARMRLRFWYQSAQTANRPGGPWDVGSGGIGVSFNPVAFGASSSNLFFFDFAAGGINMPLNGTSMTIWAGITFDNNNGGTGASAAQMNLLGQATANPSPTVGTSNTSIFRTTAAGSFFGSNESNMPGTILNLAANTNLAWEIVAAAPAPSAVAIFGLGGLVAGRRRRA